jgi:hypothetical protein
LSKTGWFFVDRNRLLVAVGRQEKQAEIDRALAYGLACAADGDLLVVVPAGSCSSVAPLGERRLRPRPRLAPFTRGAALGIGNSYSSHGGNNGAESSSAPKGPPRSKESTMNHVTSHSHEPDPELTTKGEVT